MAKPKVAPLPEVPAPPLDDFRIEVEAPPPITEDQLTETLGEILRAQGKITQRGLHEPITEDDEVLVDFVAFAGGKIVPFSARTRVWMLPDDDALLPGARARLNGKKAGDKVSAEVTFSADFVIEPLAGKTLRYEIKIHSARNVVPPSLDDPKLLALFSAKTTDQMFERIYADLEIARQDELQNRVQFAVFDELQYRLGDVEIPAEILDAELAARWVTLEGSSLKEQGVSLADQQLAQAAFVHNEGARAELTHGLRITMALAAVAKAHQLRPTKQQIGATFERFAKEANMTREAVESEIRGSPDDHAALGSSLLLECAAEWVLSKASVEVKDDLG
jgi:trigger factor